MKINEQHLQKIVRESINRIINEDVNNTDFDYVQDIMEGEITQYVLSFPEDFITMEAEGKSGNIYELQVWYTDEFSGDYFTPEEDERKITINVIGCSISYYDEEKGEFIKLKVNSTPELLDKIEDSIICELPFEEDDYYDYFNSDYDDDSE